MERALSAFQSVHEIHKMHEIKRFQIILIS